MRKSVELVLFQNYSQISEERTFFRKSSTFSGNSELDEIIVIYYILKIFGTNALNNFL